MMIELNKIKAQLTRNRILLVVLALIIFITYISSVFAQTSDTSDDSVPSNYSARSIRVITVQGSFFVTRVDDIGDGCVVLRNVSRSRGSTGDDKVYCEKYLQE